MSFIENVETLISAWVQFLMCKQKYELTSMGKGRKNSRRSKRRRRRRDDF